MASRWRHCADLTGPGIEPQTSRTDSVRLATELTTGPCYVLYYTKISIRQNLIEFSESNLKSYLQSQTLNNLISFVVLKANFLFYRTGVAGISKTRCSYRVNSLCYAFALYRFVVHYDLDQMQMTRAEHFRKSVRKTANPQIANFSLFLRICKIDFLPQTFSELR